MGAPKILGVSSARRTGVFLTESAVYKIYLARFRGDKTNIDNLPWGSSEDELLTGGA